MNEQSALSSKDSDVSVLMPNCLLIGHPFSRNPGKWKSDDSLKSRLHLGVQVVDDFWRKWMELYAPTLIAQNKWFNKSRNLKVGDTVLVKSIA